MQRRRRRIFARVFFIFHTFDRECACAHAWGVAWRTLSSLMGRGAAHPKTSYTGRLDGYGSGA